MTAQVNIKAFITSKKEDKEYSLVCSNDSNLGEAYEAWQEIGNYLIERIKQDFESRKPQKEAVEAPKEVECQTQN